MPPSNHFWNVLDTLLAASKIVIDRPKGSTHPRYPDFIYPYDYGYLEGTLSSDQGGIDVWVGSLPGRAVSGIIATVDLVKKDSEIKILLGCTVEEAQEILQTHNNGPQAGIFIARDRKGNA